MVTRFDRTLIAMATHALTLPKLDYVIGFLADRLIGQHPRAATALAELKHTWQGEHHPTTLNTYANTLYTWTQWLSRRDGAACPIGVGEIKAYVDSLAAAKLKARTMARYLDPIHQVLAAVEATPAQADTYLRDVRLAVGRETRDRRYPGHATALLTRERLLALGAVANPADAVQARTLALAWTLYDTLLPPGRIFGESIGIEWVTPPLPCTALVRRGDRHQLQVGATDKHAADVRDLSRDAIAWIERYHRLRGSAPLMFTNRFGAALQTQSWLKDMIELLHEAGLGELKISVDSCRRGAARELLERGVSAKEICRLAGWRSMEPVLRLTAVYTPTTLRTDDGPARPALDVEALRALKTGNRRRIYRRWHQPAGPAPFMADLFSGEVS
jgi:site-specific recombinase XerD